MCSNEKFDFSLLPHNVIVHILTYLDFNEQLTAAQICKTWYNASSDPLITQNFQITIHNNFENLDLLIRPFSSLKLFETNFNDFDFINFLKTFGRYIKIVEFDKCLVSLRQLVDSLILTTNLSSITINANKTFINRVDKSVYLNSTIATNLNRVEHFHVSLDSEDSGGLAFLMCSTPNLKMLSFVPMHFNENFYKSFYDYVNILEGPNLKHLKIGMKFGQFKPYFYNYLKRLTNLRQLSITCRSLNSVDFNKICPYMTKLSELVLNEIKCSNIQVLGNLPNLKKLTLSYNAMGNENPSFLKLQNLNHLRIEGFVSHCVLKSICQNCTNLTALELFSVENKSFEDIFQNLLKLKMLHLSFRRKLLKNEKVDHDITNLVLLEELFISDYAPGMTLRRIEQLPNLKRSSIELIRKIPATYGYAAKMANVNDTIRNLRLNGPLRRK